MYYLLATNFWIRTSHVEGPDFTYHWMERSMGGSGIGEVFIQYTIIMWNVIWSFLNRWPTGFFIWERLTIAAFHACWSGCLSLSPLNFSEKSCISLKTVPSSDTCDSRIKLFTQLTSWLYYFTVSNFVLLFLL